QRDWGSHGAGCTRPSGACDDSSRDFVAGGDRNRRWPWGRFAADSLSEFDALRSETNRSAHVDFRGGAAVCDRHAGGLGTGAASIVDPADAGVASRMRLRLSANLTERKLCPLPDTRFPNPDAISAPHPSKTHTTLQEQSLSSIRIWIRSC